MKFLVVDDSTTMRRILVNSLRRIGYTDCVEAAEGREALAKFDATVDFVITDWNMPVMSGLELARALRARADGAVVPLLMITNRNVKDDIHLAIEAGASSCIVKPFTPHMLNEKIDAILAAVPTA